MTIRIVAIIEGKEELFYSTDSFVELASDIQYSRYIEKPPRLIRVKNHNNRDVIINSTAIVKMSEDE